MGTLECKYYFTRSSKASCKKNVLRILQDIICCFEVSGDKKLQFVAGFSKTKECKKKHPFKYANPRATCKMC